MRITAMSSPLLRLDVWYSWRELYDFYRVFWGRVLNGNVPKENDEYIYGETGNYYHQKVNLREDGYLEQSFVEWLIKNWPLIPASDGNLYRISEVLEPTDTNIALFGKYLPVLSIEGSIEGEWRHLLPMKKKVSLLEFLEVLDKISKDGKKEEISENKKRIIKLYEYISDTFNGSSDYDTIREWGKTHKILSKEGTFELPSQLSLLGRDVAIADVEGQVYHDKSLENDRFANMMTAMGVKFINDYKVDLSKYEEDEDNVKLLKDRIDFLTAISKDEKFTQSSWDSQEREIASRIDEISFYRAESIKVFLGNQSFEKTVYTDGTKFYYVGKFGIANRELLSKDLAKALGIRDTSTLLTLLGMDDFKEMREYIGQKGYETSFIIIRSIREDLEIKVEAKDLGGLTDEEKRSCLEEAKVVILGKLLEAGYETSEAKWGDGWTCVNGVKKDGKEYPLVIRSNRSGRNTIITSKDWMQLMRPNAMFAVYIRDKDGINKVGTIDLKSMLKEKDNITIRFSSKNIDDEQLILELATVFTYFKGIQIDFERFVEPAVGKWLSFMAPEKRTGEEAIPASKQALPE